MNLDRLFRPTARWKRNHHKGTGDQINGAQVRHTNGETSTQNYHFHYKNPKFLGWLLLGVTCIAVIPPLVEKFVGDQHNTGDGAKEE